MTENLPDNSFFRIDGGNGATFFFSAASFADWRKSLDFYQGISLVAKIKKFLLMAAYPVFARKAKMTKEAVASELADFLPEGAEVAIGDHDSAMISPTRDKVIVHHHGRSYEKFAFGKSREGAARELALYRQLQQEPPRCFSFSPLLGATEKEAFVHLEMGYAPKTGEGKEGVPPAVFAEFFARKKEPDAQWSALWEQLQLPVDISEADRTGSTPVGLVHRDFKPWNVKSGNPPQLFDFESVSTGLPLEDFFNYTVDPALNFGSARDCMRQIRGNGMFDAAGELLAMQGISREETGRYWRWYLCRLYDTCRAEDPGRAEKFLALYHLPLPGPERVWHRAAALTGVMAFGLLLRIYYAMVHPLESRDATGYLLRIGEWFRQGDEEFLHSFPPLFFYLTRALMYCGMEAETAALTVNLAAGTLLLIPLYLAGRAIWRKHSAGVAAAALGAVMPNLVKFSCAALREGLYLHFTAWSIAFWAMTIRADEKKSRWKYTWSFLCGIAIAAGSMCRYEMALFLPFVLVTIIAAALLHRTGKQAIGAISALGAGFVFGLLILTSLPGMPDIIGVYVNKIRQSFWDWEIRGLK